jgi:hypothetical protein
MLPWVNTAVNMHQSVYSLTGLTSSVRNADSPLRRLPHVRRLGVTSAPGDLNTRFRELMKSRIRCERIYGLGTARC